jgi:hypothetical protein
MQCKHHPDTAATTRCSGCAESFCENCIIELAGQPYCGSCKVMALKGRPLVVPRVMVLCDEAKTALTMAIVGVFCFGPIFGVIAIFKGLNARDLIAKNPLLVGSGMATTAVTVGAIDVIAWLFGIFGNAA